MEHKQNTTIYLVSGIGNGNNSVDFEDDEKTFDKVKDALGHAKEVTREYGMRSYVYKCVPILRIDRSVAKVNVRDCKKERQ